MCKSARYDRPNKPVSQLQNTFAISAKPEIGLAGGGADGGTIEAADCTAVGDAGAAEAAIVEGGAAAAG
jgi:hypothetical protein